MDQAWSYCAICGGPFSGAGDPWDAPWLKQSVLLSEKAESVQLLQAQLKGLPETEHVRSGDDGETSEQVVCIHPARVEPDTDYNCFKLIANEQHVEAYAYAPRQHIPIHPLLLPTHEACLTIARKLIASSLEQTPFSSSPKLLHLRDLWDVLNSRFHAVRHGDLRCEIGEQRKLPEPNNYYMPPSIGGWSNDSEMFDDTQEYEADPVCIVGLSQAITSLLRPLPTTIGLSTNQEHQKLAILIQAVPEDVNLDIATAVGTDNNLPLQTTRLFDSRNWKDGLIKGNLVPYLWDLNPEDFSQFPALQWDYERLVRQLSQSGFWEWLSKQEPHPVENSILFQLRNRRRIWRILEGMAHEHRVPPPRMILTPHYHLQCSQLPNCPRHNFVYPPGVWACSRPPCTGNMERMYTGKMIWRGLPAPGVDSVAVEWVTKMEDDVHYT